MASTDAQASLSTVITGTGTTIDFQTAKSRVSGIVRTSGTVNGGSVAIEASHDGTNWVKKATFLLVDARGAWSYDLQHGAYRYWRGRVLRNVAGGGNVSVTFMEADPA